MGSLTVFQLLLIPLISMLIGWGTNRMAVRMLFIPRRPLQIFGFTIQGLIPRRHAELAQRTAETVAAELLNSHTIQAQCRNVDLTPHLQAYAQKLVHQELRVRALKIPLLGNFISEDQWRKIELWVADEMQASSETLLQEIAKNLETQLNVRELVEARMLSFGPEKLETLICTLAAREFKTIELLGAWIGLTVGIVQCLLLAYVF